MSLFSLRKPTSVIWTKTSKPNQPVINKWLYLKVGLSLVLLIFVYALYKNGSQWLGVLDKMPIRSYALTHKTHFTTNADIRQILQPSSLKGYFEQDIQEVKDRFLAIPWVKEVVVRKRYPNSLAITLVEYYPVARWNDKQFVSEDGHVFELPADRIPNLDLPLLYGTNLEAKKVLEAWYKIKHDLISRQLGLKSVSTDNRGAWQIVLDNQIELRLGRGDWLPKIDRFVMIFPHIQVPEGKRIAYVDLRYESGASVGFISQ